MYVFIKGSQRRALFRTVERVINHKLLLLASLLLSVAPLLSQTSIVTWHYDNFRSSANTSETVLTPANVNTTTFGKLSAKPVDGFVVAAPLYLPNVSIPGRGIHNLVYVVTLHDSVYAFDADNTSTAPLWKTSILSLSPSGATPTPGSVKGVTNTTGWSEVGIVSTPVIDPVGGTIYVVAETYENGVVKHRLHALDVTTGAEKLGGPALISASYTFNGVTTRFKDLYQLNRPGLLLANGNVYIGWGSNCCNGYSQGWVMSYNATTLKPEGAFTTEPGKTLASIWQKGAGLSADSAGYIYAETGEGYYSAGSNLSISVIKLSQSGSSLLLADWFTPYNHTSLSTNDQDLNDGVLVLPDQPGTYPHEMIAEGKAGTIYVLNRDNMGHLCSTCTAADTQIVQELPNGSGHESGTPVYWNNRVYFSGYQSSVRAYSLKNGLLVLSAQSVALAGPSHAVLTSNATSNAVLWFINGRNLWALDGGSLKTLYHGDQAAGGRDILPPLAHFAAPVVANGKVYIGTQNSLVTYGLLAPQVASIEEAPNGAL